jgi:hypothetical protein
VTYAAISKLKAEHVRLLVEGRASLVFLPLGATIVPPASDADEVRLRLDALNSRQEATAYVDGLKLKKSELLVLARHLGVAVQSKDTVAVLKKRIVDGTVGARADVAAIRNGSW